jgi:hypothetical protein
MEHSCYSAYIVVVVQACREMDEKLTPLSALTYVLDVLRIIHCYGRAGCKEIDEKLTRMSDLFAEESILVTQLDEVSKCALSC